jgi:hypothetical protein
MEACVTNLSGTVRRATLEGRNYLVVPMVMITEGVHNGSAGPLYYSAQELAKTPQVWNHKPIVVYHPRSGSACEPEVIETRKVGIILNTQYRKGTAKTPGKLVAEAWLEPDRVQHVDNRVLEALESDSITELSTGLYTDNLVQNGTFQGKSYVAIAQNLRPDHLAILPDEKGACSIEDGAGLLRLNSEAYSPLRKQLAASLGEGFELRDVHSSSYVFTVGDRHYCQRYTLNAQGLPTKDGEAEEVDEVLMFRLSDGSIVGNVSVSKPSDQKEPSVDRARVIGELIANKSFDETDRPALEALPDATLMRLSEKLTANNKAIPAVTPPTETTQVSVPVPVANGGTPVLAPAPAVPTPLTPEEWLAQAPEDVQALVGNALNAQRQRKEALVAAIVANSNNRFTPQYLNSQPVDALEGMASLAGVNKPAPVFLGATGAPPVVNAAAVVEPLPRANWDFAAR